MLRKLALATTAILLALTGVARAADVLVRITDQKGDPAANAVITLSNDATTRPGLLFENLEREKLVDQRDETFFPHVTVIPVGGEIRFANSDAPLHQVYSFSSIKRFELTLEPGETSAGIVFDKTGVAAIGRNIHDHMIAYIFVSDSPWTIVTDEDGQAKIEDIPAGTYSAKVWHPRFPPATEPPHSQIVIADIDETFETRLTLLPIRDDHRSHGVRY